MLNVIGQICKNVKNYADKVTDTQDYHNKSVSFKPVLNVQLSVDLGMIGQNIVGLRWITASFVQLLIEEFLQKRIELLCVKQLIALFDPDALDQKV